MSPCHTFAKGDKSAYRFTEEGWNRRHEWINGLSTETLKHTNAAIRPVPVMVRSASRVPRVQMIEGRSLAPWPSPSESGG